MDIAVTVPSRDLRLAQVACDSLEVAARGAKEGILSDSFEVAQSRDGLPRSEIGGRLECAKRWAPGVTVQSRIEPLHIAALLDWYEANRRRLPWREEPTPYHVWVSEIMLQQTRVEAVKPYYARFLEALPDIRSLARSREDALMKLWQGLGYYSRARNLRRAAILIERDYGGVMPSDLQALLALPGIGSYTAGAIASIAFGARCPAVDGNVLRIWSRMCADPRDISKDRVKRKAADEIEALLPEQPFAAGRVNQALMDLGATVCLPGGAPRCRQCPWNGDCEAHRRGREQEFPVKARKSPRRVEERTILLIEDEGRVLLRKRPSRGLLAGLYELPGLEGHRTRAEVLEWCGSQGIRPLRVEALPAAKHVFTHLEWHMVGYRIHVDALSEFMPEPLQGILAGKEEIETRYSIPSAFSDYILYIN